MFDAIKISIIILRGMFIIKSMIGRNNMQKNPLTMISIIIACAIFLASFTNVVGFQTIKISHNVMAKDEIVQKDLLFQIILNTASNRDVQQTIQKYEDTDSIEQSLKMSFVKPLFINPRTFSNVLILPSILTKTYLEFAYKVGARFLKIFNSSKIRLILEQYQINNKGVQKEIATVIDKNSTLKNKMNDLLNVNCDCDRSNTTGWNFPILCTILYPIAFFIFILWLFLSEMFHVTLPLLGALLNIMFVIADSANCFWAPH